MDKKDRYDSLIKFYAEQYNLDWRLVKKQIAAESNFNPSAESPVGAKGLGQFMPDTWKEWGEGDIENPEEQIHALCAYMTYLYSKFGEIPEHKERYKFALAAYNCGRGNVNRCLEEARLMFKAPAAYSKWVEADRPKGNWQKWDMAKGCLNMITGEHSKETINYVDKIMN